MLLTLTLMHVFSLTTSLEYDKAKT